MRKLKLNLKEESRKKERKSRNLNRYNLNHKKVLIKVKFLNNSYSKMNNKMTKKKKLKKKISNYARFVLRIRGMQHYIIVDTLIAMIVPQILRTEILNVLIVEIKFLMLLNSLIDSL